MISTIDTKLTIIQQCDMVGVQRSSYYDFNREEPAEDHDLKSRIESIYTAHPEYGSRRITEILKRGGVSINRKRTQRLMQEMGVQGIHPKRNLSLANAEHKKYPYIARDVPIVRINQVWSTDITYLIMPFGVVYLVAIIDWHSRLIISFRISNSMGEDFCIDALDDALKRGTPDIFNTDQGSQFTGNAFISVILQHNIKPSMDGKGRATDNAPSERFWRSIKYEDLHLHDIRSFTELHRRVANYIKFYNHERPHQSVGYKTPSEVHFDLEKKTIDPNGQFVYTEKELKFMVT